MKNTTGLAAPFYPASTSGKSMSLGALGLPPRDCDTCPTLSYPLAHSAVPDGGQQNDRLEPKYMKSRHSPLPRQRDTQLQKMPGGGGGDTIKHS
jgi:hypothetical protein